MAKFHDTGTICEATKRACPLGLSDSDHIEAGSIQEFEKKLGEKMAAETYGTVKPLSSDTASQPLEENSFELTHTEKLQGITVEDVERESARGIMESYGDNKGVIMDGSISSSLAKAAARHRLGGPVEYAGLLRRQPVYRLRNEPSDPIKRDEMAVRWAEEHSKGSQTETPEENSAEKEGFQEPTFTTTEGYGGTPGWEGNKRGASHIPLKEVAKKVRQDLKDATKAGYLPKGLKYSVRKDNNSLYLEVLNLPPDDEVYTIKKDFTGRDKKVLKPEYEDLRRKLQAIHDSYNYDNSDSMSDYFDRGYYGRVEFLDDNTKAWRAADKDEAKLRAMRSKAKKTGISREAMWSNSEFQANLKEARKSREDYIKILARERKEANPEEFVKGQMENYDRAVEKGAFWGRPSAAK